MALLGRFKFFSVLPLGSPDGLSEVISAVGFRVSLFKGSGAGFEFCMQLWSSPGFLVGVHPDVGTGAPCHQFTS